MNDLLLFVYHNYSIYISQGMVNRREVFLYVSPKMCYCLLKSIKNTTFPQLISTFYILSLFLIMEYFNE